MKECSECGTLFKPKVWNQKTCGARCSIAHAKKQAGMRYVRKSPPTCKTCGATFTVNKNQRYCSETCKQKPQKQLTCRQCEKGFLSVRKVGFCSVECSIQHKNAYYKNWYATNGRKR